MLSGQRCLYLTTWEPLPTHFTHWQSEDARRQVTCSRPHCQHHQKVVKARFELWGGSRAQTLPYQTPLRLCELNTARVCVRKGWKILLDGSLSNSSKPSRTSSLCVLLKGTLGNG